MDYRLHGIPGALLRRATARAKAEGHDLRTVLLALLTRYAEGEINPHAARDPLAAAKGAKGGSARAARMTPDERSDSARRAVAARWARAKATDR